MKTITLNGFVHCKPAESYERKNVIDGLKYDFWTHEDMKSQGHALVAPVSFSVEVADDFSPNDQFVSALEKQKKEIMAEFQARVTEIDRQIAQFLAIECV